MININIVNVTLAVNMRLIPNIGEANMTKLSQKLNLKSLTIKSIIGAAIVLILGLVAGTGIGLNIAPDGEVIVETDFTMELAEQQVPTIIETEEGQIEVLSAPTVEEVDGGPIEECPENEECGLGNYVWVDVTTVQTIHASIEGLCIDVDNAYGSQCYDTSAAVSENMTGRRLTTCGTGAASGMMNCYEQNAGDDYEVIWDATKVQPGDIAVFGGGKYGHTGIVLGYYNNGYVALLSTNQGGKACPGGGSSANVINMSMKNFIGAYRWKEYIKPEPVEPEAPTEAPVSKCEKWQVKAGDTMAKIMRECEGKVVYGAAMDEYAKTWYSLVYYPGQSVYDGWTSSRHYGLYAGDDIEHRVE